MFKLSSKPTVKELMPGLQKTESRAKSFEKVEEQLKQAVPPLTELAQAWSQNQLQQMQQTPLHVWPSMWQTAAAAAGSAVIYTGTANTNWGR